MWPNLQFHADLVTFTEKIFNGKLDFLCNVDSKKEEIFGWHADGIIQVILPSAAQISENEFYEEISHKSKTKKASRNFFVKKLQKRQSQTRT